LLRIFPRLRQFFRVCYCYIFLLHKKFRPTYVLFL
jgi:hypothetical protein